MRRLLLSTLAVLSLSAQETPKPKGNPPAEVPRHLPALPLKPTAEEQKRAELKQLLAAMQVGKLAVDVMGKALNAQAQMNPQISPEFISAFMAEATPEKIEALMLPVYDKHLTAEEVKALLTCYTSPAGASFAKKQPAIQDEVQEITQKWGLELALQAMKAVQGPVE